MYDIGIEGGTLVGPAARARTNVYIADGRVAAVDDERRIARERFDASGLLVMPGMIDAHVHFMEPSASEREDFAHGSAAALRAGVTTFIEHTHSGPIRTRDELRDKAAFVEGRSRTDFALGAHAWPGEADLAEEAWLAGAAFIKAFMCTTHGVPGHDAAQLLELLSRLAPHRGVVLVHCEDESLTRLAEQMLRETGRSDGGVIPAWRSREAELVAVATATVLARRTEARLVVAHASSEEVVDLAHREGHDGSPVIETCPQYLTLLEEGIFADPGLRKFTPPARARDATDLDRMWAALADGRIDYVSSDHAPSTRAQKRDGSIWDVHFGVPGIDTTMAVLLNGAAAGLITYERLVEVYSAVPSRVYGLVRKGRLDVGADADVAIVDPTQRWRISDEEIRSKAGWSPLSRMEITGRVVRTYSRGELVMENGTVMADPGRGKHLLAERVGDLEQSVKSN